MIPPLARAPRQGPTPPYRILSATMLHCGSCTAQCCTAQCCTAQCCTAICCTAVAALQYAALQYVALQHRRVPGELELSPVERSSSSCRRSSGRAVAGQVKYNTKFPLKGNVGTFKVPFYVASLTPCVCAHRATYTLLYVYTVYL